MLVFLCSCDDNFARLMPPMDVDQRLYVNTASNDPNAEFRRIVDDHARFLWRTLRHLGVKERDLEDTCQDVFLVAHRRWLDFRGDSSLRTWLYGIAVRLASEHRRRAYVRREIPTSEPPIAQTEPTEFDPLERRELRDLFNSVLEQLDDDARAVFVLYEIEDLDMKAVAQAVGCPLQTAYSRLYSARRRVALAVRKLEPDLAKRGHHGA
jgi:RNA polymerase sigma-70 factor, ECF subfamily